MTDTEKKLCKDIAVLEGVTCPMCKGTRKSTGRWKTSCRMCKGTGYPLYLTDPAETVRMLEALCLKWNRVLLTKSYIIGQIVVACYRDDGMLEHFFMGDDLPHPAAEAYKAMLEEPEIP